MKKGFSLAEVLIALVVIGVVASMTLPSIMSRIEQKQRNTLLRKTVAQFNEAYRLGYDRVGCWCCPNNNQRAQFLSRIYMPEQSKKWRDFLIRFAKRHEIRNKKSF